MKIVLQEDGNVLSEAIKPIKGAAQKVMDAKDTVVGYFISDKPAEKIAPAKSTFFSIRNQIEKFIIDNLWDKVFRVKQRFHHHLHLRHQHCHR